MLPLHGYTVIDLSRALAGPYCTALLADLGADVIKVESPSGDPSRGWPPFVGERSLYFDSVNRSKRSVVLDLYSDDGCAALDALLAGADLLVENFKFGTLEAMGYADARLAELNPRLMRVSVNAYGSTGPWRDRPGLDQVIQAAAGLTSVTGLPGETYRVGLPIVDITAGMNAAIGALALLLGRERGGAGHSVSTSLYETAVALSVFQGQQALETGVAPEPQGNAHPSITPYGVFPTATSDVVIAASTPRHWEALCDVLGLPSLVEDERFNSGRARTEHRVELTELLSAELRQREAAWWIEALSEAGIPCGPIQDYAEVFSAEQTEALELVSLTRSVVHGEVPVVRSPLAFDGAWLPVRSAPPALGEHSAEVLRGSSPGAGEQRFARGGAA